MSSAKQLLSVIESALLGPSPPTPAQRVELMHALRKSRPSLQSLLSYPELNREEPAGFGGPQCEHYILDSRGALVERAAVVSRERLIIGHCLVLSVLVVQTTGSHDTFVDKNLNSELAIGFGPVPFASLLEFVSEVYQGEPELLAGNDVLWTFVTFAGEDHTNIQTLSLLTTGAMLPEFQEGDAKALVAYLNVLQKVMENGSPTERKTGFLISNLYSNSLVMRMFRLISRNKTAMGLIAKGWSNLKEVDRVIHYCKLNDLRLIPLLRVSSDFEGSFVLFVSVFVR
ncbi:hypothetical protein ACJRO7_016452 [Eucalyptus globulus]|uniref:Uncharacterized protein n=1 Tax=Eucalyptus globulus TaxID=34317 RepID=A0ABD3LCM4_EUCGL